MSSLRALSRRRLLATLATAPVVVTPGITSAAQRQGRGRGAARALPPTVPKSDAERRVLEVIADYDRTQRAGSMSVPFEDGRLLRILAESAGATRVIEIGTSFGYSALWLTLGIRAAGGRLTTFDIDPDRQARARANFERAGVLSMITLVAGDAHEKVSTVKGPIDLVFSDADKDGYLDYFQKLSPQLRPGGLFVTHNMDSATPAYLEALSTHADFDTTLVNLGAGDLAITVKKR